MVDHLVLWILLGEEKVFVYDSKEINKDTLVFTPETWKWCRNKYKKRPKGCPNWGKESCPPNVKYQEKKVLCYGAFTLVWMTFKFKRYKELRKEQHPDWEDGMLGNSRHWQSALKKWFYAHILKTFTPDFPKRGSKPDYDFILGCGSGFKSGVQSCESGGLNVYETCAKNQIPINSMADIIYKSADIRFFALLCYKQKKLTQF
jgi:hypothetical protein